MLGAFSSWQDLSWGDVPSQDKEMGLRISKAFLGILVPAKQGKDSLLSIPDQTQPGEFLQPPFLHRQLWPSPLNPENAKFQPSHSSV